MAQIDDDIKAARIRMDTAKRAYNKTWRANPTAKGYPAVDRALDDLQSAEHYHDTLLLGALGVA